MNKIRICMFLALAVLSIQTKAELVVVEDLGGTSALPYYEAINPDPAKSELRALPPVSLRADDSMMLPVVSEKLSPGPVAARTVNAGGLMQPIFLIGDDPMSQQWLHERRDILAQIGAVGLAVNVRDANALSAIREVGASLQIVPAAGDDFAKILNLKHYPVLITNTAIEQ